MATIRVQKNKENPYVILNKTALEDDNLSWKAKGIFVYLMSKPDDWKCQIEDLRKKSKDGIDSIKAGLRELREHGYMIKRPIKNENNVIVEWEEILFETPQNVAKEVFKEQEVRRVTSLEKRRAKSNKSISGKATSGKPTYIINKEELNKEKLNNNILNNNNRKEEICENNTSAQHAPYKKEQLNNNKEEIVVVEEEVNKVQEIIKEKLNVQLSEKEIKTIIASIKEKYSSLNIDVLLRAIHAVIYYGKSIHNLGGFINKAIHEDYAIQTYNNFSASSSNADLKFNNFDQRTYDYEDLERKLLGWDCD